VADGPKQENVCAPEQRHCFWGLLLTRSCNPTASKIDTPAAEGPASQIITLQQRPPDHGLIGATKLTTFWTLTGLFWR